MIVNAILSMVIPLLPSIFFGFFFSFYLYWKVLDHYGLKTKEWNLNVSNFIEYIKFIIVGLVAQFFNWFDKKILALQIILYVLIAIFGVLSFGSILSSSGGYLYAMGAVVCFIISIVVWLYNVIRFYAVLPIRLTEATGAVDAFQKSWDLTDGKVLNIIGILILTGLFSLLLFVVPLLLIVFCFSGGVIAGVIGSIIGGVLLLLLSNYISLFFAFVITNYYIALRGGEKKAEVKVEVKKK